MTCSYDARIKTLFIRQMSPNKGTQFVFPICRKPSNAILLQIAFQLFFEHCNNIDTYISEKMERGPSPLIPSLFLLCLGFLIYWPSLFSLLDTLLSSFQWVSEFDEKKSYNLNLGAYCSFSICIYSLAFFIPLWKIILWYKPSCPHLKQWLCWIWIRLGNIALIFALHFVV